MGAIFDVIVVGLGAMGSAALWHLARRGARVLGIDRFTPPHHLGSSHGQTRIIREAYHEHPLYVPLVQRARALWHELEDTSGRQILHRTGAVMIGPPEGILVTGALESASLHRLEHQRWTAEDLRRRYPAFHVPEHTAAVWEPGAGVLLPEPCIELLLADAQRRGAQVLLDTPVTGWTSRGSHVVVATAARDYSAAHVILTAGPWLPELLGRIALPLTLERAAQVWFAAQPHADPLNPSRLPVFLLEYAAGLFFYGVPDFGHGLKVAFHHDGEPLVLDAPRRPVGNQEVAEARSMVDRWLPGAAGALRDATTCVYTNTPDQHFVIDRHPEAHGVLIASCCSGHGFKFATAVGEVLADLACDVPPRFDLTPFAAARFDASI